MEFDNEKIVKDMDEVVQDASKISKFFLDESIPIESKKNLYKYYVAAIEANKSKVSASVVKVNIEKITK